jgi:hypothetical protein
MVPANQIVQWEKWIALPLHGIHIAPTDPSELAITHSGEALPHFGGLDQKRQSFSRGRSVRRADSDSPVIHGLLQRDIGSLVTSAT